MKRVLVMAVAIVLLGAFSAAAQSTGTAVQKQQTTVGPNFVDNNGDGICDLYQSGARAGQGQGQGKGRYGKRDGTGTGVGPRDGSGYGRGPAAGGGVCDGTGPKGRGRGARR